MSGPFLISDLSLTWQNIAVNEGYKLSDRAKEFCLNHLGHDRKRIGEIAKSMGIAGNTCYQWRCREGVVTTKFAERDRKLAFRKANRRSIEAKFLQKHMEISKRWLNGKSCVESTGIKNPQDASGYISKLRTKYGEELFPRRA